MADRLLLNAGYDCTWCRDSNLESQSLQVRTEGLVELNWPNLSINRRVEKTGVYVFSWVYAEPNAYLEPIRRQVFPTCSRFCLLAVDE